MSFHRCHKVAPQHCHLEMGKGSVGETNRYHTATIPQQNMEDATKYPPLPLFLKDGHYRTLKPGLTPFPMSWHHSPSNSKWDAGNNRGGGKSEKSVRSWLPPPSSPAKSYRSWLPQSSTASPKAKTAAKSYKSWLPPSSGPASPSRAQSRLPPKKIAKCVMKKKKVASVLKKSRAEHC